MPAAVDFLCNPITNTVVDAVWARAARAEGYTRVRAPLVANGARQIPWSLAAQGAAAWKAAGVALDVVLAFEYLPPFTDEHGRVHYPNEPVGTGTRQLTTPYTEHFRLQIEAHGSQLLAAGVEGFYAWNESQVGLVLPGDNCPPGTRLVRDRQGIPLRDAMGPLTRPDPALNRSCLDPTAYATLVWQTCHSLEHIGCKRRIAGAFNIRPSTGLDLRNPYLLAYLGGVYGHLQACGVKPNWTHLGLTIYGYWTLARATQLHETIRGFMGRHGDAAELVCAEWGVENTGFDAARVTETGKALTSVFGEPHIFQRPGRDPYLGSVEDYPGYGLHQWREADGRFILGAPYPLNAAVSQVYAP